MQSVRPQLPPGRPPQPPPEVLFATGHNWAVFLAPTDTQGKPHLPQEPYYYERNNGITTWIRPFDYIEPEASTNNPNAALAVGEEWQRQEVERKQQVARKRAKQDKAVRQSDVLGTSWLQVETKQGRKYYYNTKTGESCWKQPIEVTKALHEINQQRLEEQDVSSHMEGTEMNVEDAEWMLAQMEADQYEDGMEEASDNGETSIVEESDATSTILLSKSERVERFKSMLREANVNPFGTWDTQMNKLREDPRLEDIKDSIEQQDLFDSVCSEIIAQRRQMNSEKQNDRSDILRDPFDQLLHEKVKKKTSFAKFCQRNLKDPRYLTIKTSREREKRFTKHIESLD
ncbi:transcription elongation regulator [Coemansia sp. RSA 988]|nr:transcription elongation regulator [Coemansia sp. RSA 988]